MNNRKLIRLVKDYPILYDINHEHHNAHSKKEEIWKKISDALHMSEYNCKQTWFQLRDAYRRTVRKRAALNGGQMKKWKYEDDLKFLEPNLRYRPKHPLEEDGYDQEIEQLLNATMDDTEPFLNLQSSIETVEKSTKASESNTLSSALLMQYILEMKKKDDLDLCFAGLAGTVRKFPKLNQAVVKEQIQRLVSKMEIELARRNAPVLESPPLDYPAEPEYVDTNDFSEADFIGT